MNYHSPLHLPLAQRALLALNDLQSRLAESEQSKHEAIAIIGLGCRFPQADNPEAFWRLLQTGTDAITEVPANRWDLESYYDPNPDAPGKIYSRCGGFLDQVDEFDPQFFSISLREARSLDPQQRLLLEVSWEALEQANQVCDRLFQTPTGVFVGITTSDYALRSLQQDNVPIDAYFGTGNALSVAAGRVSYTLGLTGPSLAVDTACSSSLVAVHLACQSLRQGECRMALAGGVNLLLSPENSISISKARMLSVDGRCKTFDARADGYVRGEGCGVVVLKRLREAIADGDTILATIRGSAVNQDGPSGGLTVPNGPAQQSVIRQALAQAQIEPHQVQYVEAHGTGTALGDPIEIQALGAVYGEGRSADTPLIIGSVKTNIGHLEPAAGISGLIKLVLALTHAEIPAHLHFQQPSPHIPWADLPVTIPTRSLPWVAGSPLRLAGLSSFGFSGTNAHLIVAEAPLPVMPASGLPASGLLTEGDRPLHLFTLSGKSAAALPPLAQRYVNHLKAHPDIALGDLCLTANAGRSHFKHRLALIARSSQRLSADLELIAQQPAPSASRPIRGTIAFLFTGQGSQYSEMGQQLYQTQPIFREVLTRCAEILTPFLDIPLLELLYPALYPSARSPHSIDETRYAQPALFALEYALAQLWQAWGIRPTAVMGHSLGEYVAACVAGVFSLEDGLKLIAHRAQLMQSLPPNGAMVAVLADEAIVAEAIAPYGTEVSIAAFNGSRNLVISGIEQAVDRVVQTLQSQGIKTQRLAVSHAFHSSWMEPMLGEFHRITQEITYHPPRLNLISNLTGTQIGSEGVTADYWMRHVRQPVRFAQGMAALLEQEYDVFLEIGAKPTLLGMAQRMKGAAERERLWLPSLRSDEDNWQTLLSSLGQLFVQGIEVDWLSFDQPYGYRRLPGLPTYPFQRQRYWFSDGLATLKTPIAAPIKIPMQISQVSQPQISQPQQPDRRSQLLRMLQDQVGSNWVGEGILADPQATFLELGADSINLLDTIQILEQTFGIQVSMQQLFAELTTLEALAAYLDQSLPPDWGLPDLMRSPPQSLPSAPLAATSSSFTGILTQIDHLQQDLSHAEAEIPLVRVIHEQLSVLQTVMTQQLAVLQTQLVSNQIVNNQIVSNQSNQLVSDRTGQPSLNRSEALPALPGSNRVRSLPTTLAIPKTSLTNPLLLSVAQQQMWWVETLAETYNVYLIPAAVQIEGRVNLSALEQSLNAVIARHDSLRTTFHVQEGHPIQRVHPERSLQLSVLHQETGMPSASEIQSLISRLAAPRFNLETDLLLRAQLVQWCGDESPEETRHSALILVVHHIISDAWSVGVLIQELLALYPGFCAGQAITLPALPIQYGDFAVWQRQTSAEGLEANLAYWRSQLAAPMPLTLPTDAPHPAQPTFRGRTYHQRFESALGAALRTFSQQVGVTLFMTLMGAYGILLHRYSGQTDLLIGSTFAARQQPQVQPLIGLFLNTLVFRVDTSGNPTVQELLARVKQVALDAFAHPEIPFEELSAQLPPEERRNSWFQAMFILQTIPRPVLSLPDLSLSLVPVHGEGAKCDLSLWIEDSSDGLRAEWEYNCDLFETATIERMAAQFNQLLESLVQDSQRAIAQLPLLSPEEQRYLTAFASRPSPTSAPLQPAHQGIELQAQRTPAAIALEGDGMIWTYQTLNERANQIAHALRSAGIAMDALVGVCLDRSPALIATLLGVLKAGATYVPLDPTYPSERLHQMLDDAQVTALVTRSELQSRLQLNAPIVLDITDPQIAHQSTANLDRPVSLAQIAYIIYTSGSTGKPKGVRLSHRGLANFVQQAIAQYEFCAGDRVLQFASISFDAAVEEIYGTLCSGGTLVLRTDEMLANSTAFCQAGAAQNLTVLDLPTAFWHRLTQDVALGIAHLPVSLRMVIIGGERVLPQTIQLWQQVTQPRPVRLLNTYGPTEATVVATTYEITPQTPVETEVPIGKPLGNVQVYVLDEALQQVPIGVSGELYLGGYGLAEGYLNRPELTAERFISHPFRPNETLYKTGDRVRFLLTGDLVYLGRTDDQVKIRGFRVELGEVESLVQQHPAVRECAVIAQTDRQGSPQLIAYVVLSGATPTSQELRQFLQTQVPDYLVPALFMTVESIPLTPTGKLDRRSLPQPQAADWAAPQSYMAPRTPTEAALTFMVAEVLGLERVGIHDDFFSLGGHSLSAMQILARIRTMFQREISLRSLFEDPTIAALAAELERADSTPSEAGLENPIALADRTQPLPLSFAQQRLWFLNQLEGSSATYNLPFALRLKGQVNVTAFEQCLATLIERHEVLRTTFSQSGDQGIQVVHPPLSQAIVCVDLSHLEAEAIQQQIAQAAQQPFDLQAEALLRVSLLRLQPEEHILLVTMHHMISDAWSIGLFVQAIMVLYPAYCQGQVPQVAPLPIQYADYAVWQHQQQLTESFQQRLQVWVQQFVNAPPLLELPTDRSRPAVQRFRGGLVRVELPPALTQPLKTFSQHRQKTLFMTLLAAFVTLMHRYSRQSDLVVGIPIAGRTHPQLESLIGFFINTLPLRFSLEADTPFASLLEQVQTNTLEAYAHQDIPFEKLLERLPLARDLSYLPLCQVMFVLQNAPLEELQLPGLTLEPLPTHSGVSRFDLTLSMVERGDRLIAEWEYNSDLFEAETIERMAAQFEVLLQSIVANPQQSLATLPLLTPMERQTLLTDWNQTQAAYPQTHCIHQLITAQAERTPNAIALICTDATLTYRELNDRANQLGHYLQSQGISSNSLVGLCVERSSWMLIGLLGILKAGAAYIPLDPAFPAERLALMVEDAQLALLLTQTSFQGQLPASRVSVICLDTVWSQVVQQPNWIPVTSVSPRHPAYVIYTSGSTGRPKGVQVSHQNVVNFLSSMHQAPGLTPKDILLSVTTLSFDIAVLELFLPLTLGACVVVASREVAVDGDRLSQLLTDSGATVMQATPSTWRMLLDAGWQGSSTLKILCGGEALPPQLAERLTRRCAALWNLYGPTETTVWSLLDRLEVGTQTERVAIGRPIANTQAYVVDPDLQPVPIGVPGELLIGGDGVTQGYLNQPHLTAERFIQNPFSHAFAEQKGDRLYRTGDLVRYRPDGRLEYLGRLDHQVKLRGFRIELGEIEGVLQQHPGVSAAIAIVRQSETGIQTLAAYVVPAEPDQTLTVQSLQQFTKDRLPQYMVPAAFVMLEALPLTPNGKVDRKALPAPQSDHLRGQGQYVAPRTELEATLAQLWAELLGIARVGVEDNFFELGGHSLAAMQLVSRIRRRFHQDVALRSLFESPTIAALAAQLQDGTALEACETGSIARVDRTQPLPLSFAQQRLWFLSQLEGASATYNIPIALRLQGALDHAALKQCFAEIVARHEVLRTQFAQADGEGMQVIHLHLSIPIPLVDLAYIPTGSQAEAVAQHIQAEAQYCFDLQTDALLRVKLLQLSAQEHILLLTMHHIISDAWSLGLFVREIMALYPAFCQGQVPEVAPLPIQYADYAAWQRQQQLTETFQQRLEARAQQFVDAPPLLELPTDHPRPAVQTFRGGRVQVELPSTLSQQLQSFSRQRQKTLFMTLLAAFATLMHRYSRQSDLVIGTPIAGRNHPDLEVLMGFFINTLPLRFSLAADLSYGAFLEQVQTIALDAFTHQDIPFEKLMERLPLARDLSYLPLCQVMFVLQNAPLEELQLPGLTLEPLLTHSGVSRFDLTLSMVERGDRLIADWEYNSDLFEAETIERMAAQFEVLLQSVITNPQQSLATLPILTAAERQTLLIDWNRTQMDLPQRCIHHWFEDQVERTPDAIALAYLDSLDANSPLSYRDLNRQANQLAHFLQSLGLQPDQLIGICLERSVEMVVAMLAVFKAGAAYVPLDPTYPIDRLTHMVNDAQLQVLILSSELESRFPALSSSVQCLKLEAIAPLLQQQPSSNPTSAVTPNHLAYVIYTSGSTGLPKGVMIEHRGLGNLAFAQIQAFHVTVQSRILQMASFSFDASVSEVFMALCAGAQLRLGRIESLLGNGAMLQHQGITHLTIPPSALSILPLEDLAPVDHLIVAGEACPAEIVAQWSHRPGFYNAYGPTEVTVCGTIAACTATHAKPPIGRPIQNVQVYVVDQQLQPVPLGVPGELLIGGIGLARGYLHRADLTADRFIGNPFSGEGDRLYRTGDLVRYRPDGQLDYLGRIDHQVKLRGFRIELGEIESVLLSHTDVKETIALVQTHATGSQILTAYVVPETQTSTTAALTVESLQQWGRDRLPQYMVPTAFVMLEVLPLTPNGKVDRQALPAPLTSDRQVQYIPPRNAIEETLAQIWSELLGIATIGVMDNFFELGGHSLLALQVLSRIQKLFQVQIQLQPLFEQPTIAQLAELVLSEQLQQTDDDILEQLLAELEDLPEEEAQQILLTSGQPS